MTQQYAEVIIARETVGWRLLEYSDAFLELTGFTHQGLEERFQCHFMRLLSNSDMEAADVLFSSPFIGDGIFPWIFTLTCNQSPEIRPVLLQRIATENETDTIHIRVNDALFLGEHTQKMSRRLLSLEKSIPGGLCQFLYDDDFTILWHNDTYLEVLGYTEEQYIEELGYKASGYVHPDDTVLVFNLLEQELKQGPKAFTVEIRVYRRDGELRWLLTSFSFMGETVDGYSVLYSTGIDITDQKRTQQAERDAERLRFAMEQASSYILEYDVANRRLLGSGMLRKYFGISGNVENTPESIIETGRLSFDSAEILRSLFCQIELGEHQAEGVVHLPSNPEQYEDVWFRVRITSIYSDAGRPVRAVLLVEDITKQHCIEMRYHEEENRRAAMTYDMEFAFQIDLTKERVLDLNKNKYSVLDLHVITSSQELIRRNAGDYVHPDDRAEYLKKLDTEYMLQEFLRGIPEITLDFRTADEAGCYHWNRGVVHIIREPVNDHVFAYCYIKNIDAEKKRELELRRHAEQDALTGLYNRYTVELHCDRLLKEQKYNTLSVMYMLDLDNFKVLNDTYGHFQGDEMLRQVSQSMREIFGEHALLGRLGGDELMAFQVECFTHEAAAETAKQLCSTIKNLPAGLGVITVSVGLAFAPEDGIKFAELYHCTDDALYKAKRSGKNCWVAYAKSIGPQQERLPMSREWLLEASSDLIYVCDFYTHNLLYMNSEAKRIFDVGGDNYIGKKCYEILQQKSKPCSFCTNHLLCREEFYNWEFRNHKICKSYLLRDRIVDWYGIPARIEFATDISVMDQRNQALEKQVEIDNAIISCLRIMNSTKSLSVSALPMLKQLAGFYGADRAYIHNYNPQTETLFPFLEWCKNGIRTVEQLLDPHGLIADIRMLDCFERHENYLFERNETRADDTTYTHMLYDGGITSQRVVPFYIAGQTAGVIGVDNPTIYRDDMAVLETLSYFVSEELARSKLSEQLEFLGYHDSLTELYNRNFYVNYMDKFPCRDIKSLGVAVADLNNLKDINKVQGHTQGDIVVKRAADLLRDCFPDSLIFRLSGDEFVIHSENTDRLSFLEQVKRVREIDKLLQAHGISVGYAWTDRDIDCQKLTMQATDIMLMQKQDYYQFNCSSHTVGNYNHAPLRELMESLRDGRYKVYLQPKADCIEFQLNGAEALARYESLELGLVPPNRFIPMLEKEHIIHYLDLYVFEEVCRLIARWREEGKPSIPISLNFSRQTVLEPDLLKTLLTLTERYCVPKYCIEVEITESLGDYENSTIAEIGAGIKSAGFRLALDDFGSHYTNMAMLSAVPVDVLKLDRGMLQNVMSSHSNQLVLKSILSLCRELGISSIAEGVETKEQFELLQTLQCDSIQGYLFGRPTTIHEFEKLYFTQQFRTKHANKNIN